ncbi:MAG: hypothetical protein WCK11_04885 [Candidatus Falkowbacteria bacterium]
MPHSIEMPGKPESLNPTVLRFPEKERLLDFFENAKNNNSLPLEFHHDGSMVSIKNETYKELVKSLEFLEGRNDPVSVIKVNTIKQLIGVVEGGGDAQYERDWTAKGEYLVFVKKTEVAEMKQIAGNPDLIMGKNPAIPSDQKKASIFNLLDRFRGKNKSTKQDDDSHNFPHAA